MDFFTAKESPLIIKINDKEVNVPRIRLPDLNKYAEQERKKAIELALSPFDTPDQKARFLNYFPPPKLDILDVIQWSKSTDGAEYWFRDRMKLVGMSDGQIQTMVEITPPDKLREFVDECLKAGQIEQHIKTDEEKNDPNRSTGSRDVSGGSQETSGATKLAS